MEPYQESMYRIILPPPDSLPAGDCNITSIRLILRYRIKRAVCREADHHGVHNAQRRSIPSHGAGEERGREQDDQRHHIAEDPRRDPVNEADPLQELRHESCCQRRAGIGCKDCPGKEFVHGICSPFFISLPFYSYMLQAYADFP